MTPAGTINGEHTVSGRPVGTPTLSENSATVDLTTKRSRARFGFLNRTHSTHLDNVDGSRKARPKFEMIDMRAERQNYTREPTHDRSIPFDGPRALRTAPLDQERDPGFQNMMDSASRNRSADRRPSPHQHPIRSSPAKHGNNSQRLTVSASTAFRDGAGSNLFSKTLKTTSSKAADGLGKASKFLVKISRSGSSNSKERVDDAAYILQVIRLPLVEQTRRTRIAKRLEDSKDKTEFWMPALPWRCIEYVSDRTKSIG